MRNALPEDVKLTLEFDQSPYVTGAIYGMVKESAQFQMRIRAPTSTQLELNEEITRAALDIIKNKVGPENIDMSVAYVGVTAPTYTVNAIYLWTGGVDQAVMRIALRQDSGLRVAEPRPRTPRRRGAGARSSLERPWELPFEQ